MTNGQTVSIQGSASFANDGPSTSLGGTVTLSAIGDGQTLLVDAGTQAAAPLINCTKEPQRLTCSYAELRSGARASISVLAGTKVNTGFFRSGVGKLIIQWSITAPARDPHGANNTMQTVVFLCAPGATESPCNG